MSCSNLEYSQFSDSVASCGRAYGERYAVPIRGFLAQECAPVDKHLAYSAQCLPYIKSWTPRTYAFLCGMAKGAKLKLKHAALLLLHEEIFHLRAAKQTHCSAIAMGSDCRLQAGALAGQNWDWPPQYYPWASLNQFHFGRKCRVLTYSYPGLWACCGINNHGLALMWTGGGYFPVLKPKTGVPTYALISELMFQADLDQVLEYLAPVPRAGSFMLLLAHSSGECAVIEATCGAMAIRRSRMCVCRANLYALPEILKASKQGRRDPQKHHSVRREKEMVKYIRAGHFTPKSLKSLLLHNNVHVNLGLRSMTIDSLVADCARGTLAVRRGGSDANKWIEHKLS